jgi:hypothetical protein
MSDADQVRCGLLVERAAMLGYAGIRVTEGAESINIDAESD